MIRQQDSFIERRISVLGAGRTGQAVARFLAQQQAKVFVSDCAHISNNIKAEWGQWEIDWEEGGHTSRALEADLLIVSPGIPAQAPILNEARTKSISIISEIELAYNYCLSKNIIAVTGTVGKTTTTHLISELLKAHGHHVITAGNIGRPLIACLDEITPHSHIVLEISSYQLEHIESFRPHIGLFTKFAPHHLERHGSLGEYFNIKCRLFENQEACDFAIIHAEIELPKNIRSQITSFSASEIKIDDKRIAGHQRENLAAALQAARLIDPAISLDQIDLPKILQIPHRIEYVTELDGVRFYNDSKATSPKATEAALDSFPEKPLVLILGGHDSEGDALELTREISRRDVERVLLVGQTRERFSRLFKQIGYTRFESVRDLSQAIQISLEMHPKICLYSPGSPSFDQFKSYEHRGDHFKSLLKNLSHKTTITGVSVEEAASL